jgi:DNA repair protein RecN (Recombination protein N)
LMFALKYLIAEKSALPTLIFDEIDTGISGEIAMKMGQMMQKMSNGHQLITITHLHQIAAKGDSHYFVFKDETSKGTKTNIRPLSLDERMQEIAQMIGGKNPSATAFESARELMNNV